MSAQSSLAALPTAKMTAPELTRYKRQGRRLSMLTAYDATFARLLDAAGVDVILVGDSLGMVIQGRENTLAVTMEQMVYHTQAVVRGVRVTEPVVRADRGIGVFGASRRTGGTPAVRIVGIMRDSRRFRMRGGSLRGRIRRFCSFSEPPGGGHLR